MTNLNKPGLTGNGGALPVAGLPLFDWIERRTQHAILICPAANHVARRFRLPVHLAAVVAASAGLGEYRS